MSSLSSSPTWGWSDIGSYGGEIWTPHLDVQALHARRRHFESTDRTLRGDPIASAQPLFWEHEGNRAVRSGRWKLVSRYPDGWELYDIGADRVERNDLAARHPELVIKLAKEWDAWATRANVDRWTGPLRTNWGDEKLPK